MNTFLGHTRAGTVLVWPIFVYLAHSLLVSNVAEHAWRSWLACLKARADLLKQNQNCAFRVKTNTKSTKDKPPLLGSGRR